VGVSISWVAFKGVTDVVGLSRLGLSLTARSSSFGQERYLGRSLPGAWYLVVERKWNSKIVSSSSLSALSADCEVVAGWVEEHVMFSAAEGWRDGQKTWRLEHDAEKSDRHIECSGEPPTTYPAALAEAEAEQDAEDAGSKEVDFYFEIPLQVARSIVGFKHDEANPGEDAGQYTVLERVGSAAKNHWWRFWK
jgi:hypothetical protein